MATKNVAGDIVYSAGDKMELWEKLKAMGPQIVIPGHVPFDKFSTDPDATIDFIFRYLNDFDELLARTLHRLLWNDRKRDVDGRFMMGQMPGY